MRELHLTKEQAQDIVWGDDPSAKILSDTIVDIGRWSTNHECVFEKDGAIWSLSYSRGATEEQNEAPFEYDEEPIKAVPMRAVEKMVVVYEEEE